MGSVVVCLVDYHLSSVFKIVDTAGSRKSVRVAEVVAGQDYQVLLFCEEGHLVPDNDEVMDRVDNTGKCGSVKDI